MANAVIVIPPAFLYSEKYVPTISFDDSVGVITDVFPPELPRNERATVNVSNIRTRGGRVTFNSKEQSDIEDETFFGVIMDNIDEGLGDVLIAATEGLGDPWRYEDVEVLFSSSSNASGGSEATNYLLTDASKNNYTVTGTINFYRQKTTNFEPDNPASSGFFGIPDNYSRSWDHDKRYIFFGRGENQWTGIESGWTSPDWWTEDSSFGWLGVRGTDVGMVPPGWTNNYWVEWQPMRMYLRGVDSSDREIFTYYYNWRYDEFLLAVIHTYPSTPDEHGVWDYIWHLIQFDDGTTRNAKTNKPVAVINSTPITATPPAGAYGTYALDQSTTGVHRGLFIPYEDFPIKDHVMFQFEIRLYHTERSGNQILLLQGDEATDGYGMMLRINGSGTLQFYYSNADGASPGANYDKSLTSLGSVPLNQWVEICMDFQGFAGSGYRARNLNFYINGTRTLNDFLDNEEHPFDNGGDWTIGGRQTGTVESFRGYIDKVRVTWHTNRYDNAASYTPVAGLWADHYGSAHADMYQPSAAVSIPAPDAVRPIYKHHGFMYNLLQNKIYMQGNNTQESFTLANTPHAAVNKMYFGGYPDPTTPAGASNAFQPSGWYKHIYYSMNNPFPIQDDWFDDPGKPARVPGAWYLVNFQHRQTDANGNSENIWGDGGVTAADGEFSAAGCGGFRSGTANDDMTMWLYNGTVGYEGPITGLSPYSGAINDISNPIGESANAFLLYAADGWNSREWDGTTWSAVAAFPTGASFRYVLNGGGVGTVSSGQAFGGYVPIPAERNNIVDWNGTSWTDVADMTAGTELTLCGGASNDTMIHAPLFDNYWNGTTSTTVASPSSTHSRGTWFGRKGNQLVLAAGGNRVVELWNGDVWSTGNTMPFTPSGSTGDGTYTGGGFCYYSGGIAQCYAYMGDAEVYPNYPERQDEGDT